MARHLRSIKNRFEGHLEAIKAARNMMETKEERMTHQPTPSGGASPLASLVISFLKGQGFEVYRIQTRQEAYEIKSNSEILRIYVIKKSQIKKAM